MVENEVAPSLEKYQKNRLLKLKEKGIEILININPHELRAISAETDFVVFADSSHQYIDSGLTNHLKVSLDISFEDWIDPKTNLVLGQDYIFAGGNMTRSSFSLEEAIKDGRKSALAIHKKLE